MTTTELLGSLCIAAIIVLSWCAPFHARGTGAAAPAPGDTPTED